MNDHHRSISRRLGKSGDAHLLLFAAERIILLWHVLSQALEWHYCVCKYHLLSLQLGVRTNYLAEICESSSFSDKATLLEHVLDKAENAGLVLADTTTVDESRSRARDVLLLSNVNTSTAKFCALNRGDEIKSRYLLPITVECHYQRRIEKNSAFSWVEYILDRDACKNTNGRDRKTYLFIKVWLEFLFSNSDDASFGMWRWSCKHPKLNGHGIAGVGVTRTIIANGGYDNLEICLARIY